MSIKITCHLDTCCMAMQIFKVNGEDRFARCLFSNPQQERSIAKQTFVTLQISHQDVIATREKTRWNSITDMKISKI